MKSKNILMLLFISLSIGFLWFLIKENHTCAINQCQESYKKDFQQLIEKNLQKYWIENLT